MARPPVAIGNGQGFHEMPAGEVGAARVPNLPGAHQVVQRAHGLFDGRRCVEGMELEKVDVVGAKAAQAGFYSMNQVKARGADIIGARASAERCLGRDDHLVPAALDRLAQDLFSRAARVTVGRIEHAEIGLKADIHQPACLGDIRGAPRLEEIAAPAKGAGAQAQDRHFEAGAAKKSPFHFCAPFCDQIQLTCQVCDSRQGHYYATGRRNRKTKLTVFSLLQPRPPSANH